MKPPLHSLARQRGTTLIELMVALAVFLVVGGAAFSLFNKQQIATNTLQGQVGLSLSLRNAASQLQLDLANAGNGYFQGINMPTWPVGVTIMNNWVNYGTSCYSSTGGYTSSCFDQVNIITADPVLFPALHPTDSLGSASPSCPSLNTNAGSPGSQTTVYAAVPIPGNAASATAAAAEFTAGDQLLFLSSTGKSMTTARLAANGTTTASNKAVALAIYQTQPDGSNIMPANSGDPTGDPLDITACDRSSVTVAAGVTSPACPPVSSSSFNFATQYCSADWIIKLSPIQYKAAANSDPNNPWQLVRVQNGVTSVVMDQIIGFKVGAATWDSYLTSGYQSPYYNYQASTYCIGSTAVNCSGGVAAGYQFSLIRSVRASIIARTTPNNSAQYTYRNTFDGGPYQVQGTAVVVNPRNLSMSDDQALP
jgi:prepilin-type N-terminal cleavage/methylation domain-containing protein